MFNKLTTEAKLSQTTKLSPAQILTMRIIETPNVEMEMRINEELEKNPTLEEGKEEGKKEEDWGNNREDFYGDNRDDNGKEEGESEGSSSIENNDYENPEDRNLRENDDDYYDGGTDSRYDKDFRAEIPYVDNSNFVDHLKSQIYLVKGWDKPTRHIAKFIIGDIDEDGYLRRTAEQIANNLIFRENLDVPTEKIEEIIEVIKTFDPIGVGAFDTQECLLIQLRHKKKTIEVENAITVVEKHFTEFIEHHYESICKRLDLSSEEMRDVIQLIKSLDAKPGTLWSGTLLEANQHIIIPDFTIENENEKIIVHVNDGDFPDLRVSKSYRRMQADLESRSHLSQADKEALRFIKEKIDAANTFIEAIQKRSETLKKTMEAIVKKQYAFFLTGEKSSLKPMILQDIADATEYDVSTISRVSNSKYVQTEFGIYPLKFFFSESLTNLEGEEISTLEIKDKLEEIIRDEDKTNPYPDEALVEVMRENGYPIARRTIAKYREQLGIPVARMRRQL